MSQNTHWKHKMKCIQIKNEVKTINTMRHQTIDKWKGTAAAAGPPGPGGPKPCRCRRPLSFVYGLMSHCIDRFHFVFYLYTFHFMLPMCIWLIFLVIFSIFLCMVQSLCKPCPVCKPVPCPPPNDFHMEQFSTSLTSCCLAWLTIRS